MKPGDIIRASCHCGAVRIEAVLTAGLDTTARCDCSFCKRRQAANVSTSAATLKVLEGENALTLYTWGTRTAKHYFCRHCGIYTHHRRRSDPSECGVNIGCIEGVNPRDFEPIGYSDGVNHPADES